MKRVTVSVNDETLDTFAAMARRRGVTLAEITREALAAYVSGQSRHRRPLTLAGIGRSGRSDVAERAEKYLEEGFRRRRVKPSGTSFRSERQAKGYGHG